ncbi:MAG: hypothetical protein WCT01_02650 [Candidatus Shapirobacteria bacterium]
MALVVLTISLTLGGITPAGISYAAAANAQLDTIITIESDSTEHILHVTVENPASELLGIQVTLRDGTSEWFNQLISTTNGVHHVWFYPGYTLGLEYEEIVIGFDFPSTNNGSLWRKASSDGWYWSGARLTTSTGCSREPYIRLEGANVTTPAWVVVSALDGSFTDWPVVYYGSSSVFTGDQFTGWFTNLTSHEVAPIKGGHSYSLAVYGGNESPNMGQYQGSVYAAQAPVCPATVVVLPSSSRYVLDLKVVNYFEGELPLEIRTADGMWYNDQLYLQDMRGIYSINSWHGTQDFDVRFPEGMKVENRSFWKIDLTSNFWHWGEPRRLMLPIVLH